MNQFFRIVKNRRPHQNTTKLFICQRQTDNSKWLTLSTYITDMCSNIAYIFKICSWYFLIAPRMQWIGTLRILHLAIKIYFSAAQNLSADDKNSCLLEALTKLGTQLSGVSQWLGVLCYTLNWNEIICGVWGIFLKITILSVIIIRHVGSFCVI